MRSRHVRAGLVLFICAAWFLVAPTPANADAVSIKFTASALGLGGDDTEVNYENKVDPDVPGKIITSPTTGLGSILYVQTDGKAGSGGTLSDPPLLVTITAQTHLQDHLSAGVSSVWPGDHDYYAGVICVSKEKHDEFDSDHEDKDEGLGVRAFKVLDSGLRELDHGDGPAKIEGSKEVSGGTDRDHEGEGEDKHDPFDDERDDWDPNGSPHVDEKVLFDFSSGVDVLAESIVVRLTKFEVKDDYDEGKGGYHKRNKLNLHIELKDGGVIDEPFIEAPLTPSPADILQEIDAEDKVWDVYFTNIPGLNPTDLISSFSISALERNPTHPTDTSEHFLINGLSAEYSLGDDDDADWGDLPLSYATTEAQDGPRHLDGAKEWLGTLWDDETNGVPTTDAAGDDTEVTPDDEDGVQFVDGGVYVTISVADRDGGRYDDDVDDGLWPHHIYLEGWIDLDQDGTFDELDDSDHVVDGWHVNPDDEAEWGTTDDEATFFFPVPGWAPGMGPQGTGYYSRWRLSYGTPMTWQGLSEFGEVEDYYVTPEPLTALLLGVPLAVLARYRRRKKK